jgi:hypothetical protein
MRVAADCSGPKEGEMPGPTKPGTADVSGFEGDMTNVRTWGLQSVPPTRTRYSLEFGDFGITIRAPPTSIEAAI